MKLIVQTSPLFFTEEDQILTALFEEGLDILHLHKSDPQPQLYDRLLSLIPEQYHNRIMIQEDFQRKEEFGLMGIHLTKKNPGIPEGYTGAISRCCYNIEEVQEKKLDSLYVTLKYVFDSNSTIESSHYSEDELENAQKEGIIDERVYGQTGINLNNLRLLKTFGFGGVVICGDLWQRFNIQSARDFHDLLVHFRKLKNNTDN